MTDEYTKESLQIARLEERMAMMDRDMRAQGVKLDEMRVQLALVLTALSEAKGGWRTLMWLGGASATAGGCIAWALTNLRVNP